MAERDAKPALRLRELSYSYGDDRIFADLNLEVEDASFITILGPSGCGKSTLLRVISGALKQDSGTVEFSSPVPPAVMPQDDLLFPWLTILENALLYARIHGKVAEHRKEALTGLERFGLADYKDHYPSSLSGGMRQRAAFLRTALCPAKLMLLDEPFGALDVMTRREMQVWLQSMRKELKRTILLVTHDLDEALFLSDRILLMSGCRPSHFIDDLRVATPPEERTAQWLAEQTALKQTLIKKLKRRANEL